MNPKTVPARRRVVAEPRLVLLTLGALSVMVLSILAIFETDDVWIVAATVVSVALIAVAIGIDVWRLMATGDQDERDPDVSRED
jgi:uncharacterized membrane protein YqjE